MTNDYLSKLSLNAIKGDVMGTKKFFEKTIQDKVKTEIGKINSEVNSQLFKQPNK